MDNTRLTIMVVQTKLLVMFFPSQRYAGRFLLVLTLGLGLSCVGKIQAQNTPFFPIGIYGVSTLQELEHVKTAGFNSVVGPANQTFLNKAKELGIRVISSTGSSSGPGFNADVVQEKVHTLDAHPALWSWYLVDEPDLQRIPPWKVAMDQRMLKHGQASKPVSVVLYNGLHARDYGQTSDILMVDQYPIPWMPLAHFSQHLRWARDAVSPEKPVYAVLQAFDWYYFKESVPGVDAFRVPTSQELTCMTYMAVAQGMNGLFYYTLKSKEWNLLRQPDVWSALKEVIQSLNENSYLLTSKQLWWIPAAEITPYVFRKSAALKPSVSSTFFEDANGLTHLLMINTTPHALRMHVRLPASENRWNSIFLNDTPFGGFQPGASYDLPFQPYQVRLLKGFQPLTYELP